MLGLLTILLLSGGLFTMGLLTVGILTFGLLTNRAFDLDPCLCLLFCSAWMCCLEEVYRGFLL